MKIELVLTSGVDLGDGQSLPCGTVLGFLDADDVHFPVDVADEQQAEDILARCDGKVRLHVNGNPPQRAPKVKATAAPAAKFDPESVVEGDQVGFEHKGAVRQGKVVRLTKQMAYIDQADGPDLRVYKRQITGRV